MKGGLSIFTIKLSRDLEEPILMRSQSRDEDQEVVVSRMIIQKSGSVHVPRPRSIGIPLYTSTETGTLAEHKL